MLLDRIKELLYDHIKYEKDWNDNITIDFKYDSKFCDELITTIKVVDKEFYKDMLKYVCDEKVKKDAEKAKMEKANETKKTNLVPSKPQRLEERVILDFEAQEMATIPKIDDELPVQLWKDMRLAK